MFLILDFTQSLNLAIVNQNVLMHREIKIKKNISEVLIFEIDKFLKKSKINIKKIKSICVITGPGSFTGVRSAITYAKSLKLTMKLNIFGLSKFEIINFSKNIKKNNKTKCIFLHFKDNQFFTQTFKGYEATNNVRLINFDNEEFFFSSRTTYLYDNNLLEASIEDNIFRKIKQNFYLVDYNLRVLQDIILNNMIDNTDLKPLYISDYF